MKDIAEAAGVGVSTVSYALKNHPKIPEATRKRIKKVADSMGYRPDAYVSTLMARLHSQRGKSEQAVLGLLAESGILPLIKTVPYHRDWYNGMRQRADELGYRVDIFEWDPEKLPPKRLATSLQARGIRGLMVAPNLQQSAQLDFPFEQFACAAAGVSIRKPALHNATTHYAYAMELAFEKLLEKGYRKPGLVLPKPFNLHTRSGYLATYLSCQMLDPRIESIPPCLTPNYSGFAEAVQKWYEQHTPDVILTVTPDEVVAQLSQQIKIPKELGVIDLTCDAPGQFTGITQAGQDIGAAIVNLVVAQIHRGEFGVPEIDQTTLLKGTWIPGKTLPNRGSRSSTQLSTP